MNRPSSVRRWSSWCNQPWTQKPPTPVFGWRIRVGRTGLHTPVGRSSFADAREDLRQRDREVIEPDLVRAAAALVTEGQRRYVTQAYGQAGFTDPTRAASDAARGVVQATRVVAAAFAQHEPEPVEVEPGPQEWARDDPARTPAAGDEQSNPRIDRNRTPRLDLQMSPGYSDASAGRL